jgi:hypothetical protein
MYITDKRFKQGLCSYIKYVYGIEVEPNRIYVFKYDYLGLKSPVYSITKYEGYHLSGLIQNTFSAVEVDKWGVILSRKEKIEKIKNNGSR